MQTRRRLVTAAMMLATSLTAMEATIIATAVPSIVGQLGGFAEFTWVFAVYFLVQTVTIPIYGRLADILGRRPVFAVGIIIFLTGSLLCGFAQSMTQLIAFRALQGLGAGAVQPIASTIIGDMYTVRERARMHGLLNAVWGTSALSGPLLGGFILEHTTWGWIFWINLPLGLLAVIGAFLFFRESIARKRRSIDFLGAFLFMVGVSMLLLALLEGGSAWAWVSPPSLGLFAGAAFFVACFVLQERRAPEPLIPFKLFRTRMVALSDLGILHVGGLNLVMTSFIPLFAQGTMGMNPTQAGLMLAVMSIFWPLSGAITGRVLMTFGFQRMALFGSCLAVLGSTLLFLSPRTAAPEWIMLALAVFGVGMGSFSTTMVVALQGAVSSSTRGVATASNTFSRQIGSTLWVTVLGTVLNATLLARLMELPASTRAATGGEALGVTALLLDVQARAALRPEILGQLRGALSDAVHMVFLGALLTAMSMVFVATRIPRDFLHEHTNAGQKDAGSS